MWSMIHRQRVCVRVEAAEQRIRLAVWGAGLGWTKDKERLERAGEDERRQDAEVVGDGVDGKKRRRIELRSRKAKPELETSSEQREGERAEPRGQRRTGMANWVNS